jgi:iron complex outermembrane recepter protein
MQNHDFAGRRLLLGTATLLAGYLHATWALASDPVLEEIVVTARKREEKLSDVPAAVTAYDQASIERLGVKDITDTYGLTPGLYFTGNFLSPGSDFHQLVIRGIGANSQLEPSVATFVDGVYSPSLSFDSDLLGVATVEVLKGPQGSLFGRNTEGGALNITTIKPSETLRGQVKFLVDEFNTEEASASVSGPLVSGLLFGSAALSLRQSDYFVKQTGVAQVGQNPFFPGQDLIAKWNPDHTDLRGADGQRQVGTRASLRYVPTDRLEMTLAADFSQLLGVDQAPGPLASCRCHTVDGDQAFSQTSRNGGVSVSIKSTQAWGSLTSITGWRESTSNNPIDFDGTRVHLNNFQEFYTRQDTLSEELRAASPDESRLQWLAGLYGFKDQDLSDRFYIFSDLGATAALNGLWNQQIVNVHRTGWAAFGSASYNVLPQLELTAGIRFSSEEAKVAALERYEIPANGNVPYISSVDGGGWPDFYTPVRDHKTWINVSPQGSVKFHWTDDIMSYLNIGQGFKAGGYQKAPVAVSDVTPVNPEKSTNYELGTKAGFADGRLFLDASLFYIKLTDQQLQSAVVRNGIVASAITNASSSRVEGAEVSLSAKPMDGLTLWLNGGLTDSKFLNYVIVPDGVNIVDRSGSAFPNTPKWTYSVSAEYRMPLPREGNDLSLDLTYRWVDRTYVGSNAVSVDPIIDVPSWSRLDARIAWSFGNSTITLFGDNITNNYIILSRWNSFFVEPQGAFIHNIVDARRRLGLSYAYKL